MKVVLAIFTTSTTLIWISRVPEPGRVYGVLILLSSCERKRYRDDILRCIAAPEGVRVQFRYSKDLVHDGIWANPTKYEGQLGLVCSIDLRSTLAAGANADEPCRLIPVRNVLVEEINVHGQMMTVGLRIKSLARTESPDQLTKDLDGGNKRMVPRASVQGVAAGRHGYFFFSVPDEDVGRVQQVTTISDWQRITADLLTQPGYDDEPYFWTVLGLWRDTPGKAKKGEPEFRPWSPRVHVGRNYSLVVHTYHPNTDAQDFTPSRLLFRSEPAVTTNYPLDVVVDSPYDVKMWRFKITSASPEGREGWFTIGPERVPPQNPPQTEWDIDLPVYLRPSILRFLGYSATVGVLIAAPAILSIMLQTAPSASAKVLASAVSVVFCVLGAAAAGLGLKKPT